jgi:LCP family protein required for cell wall assembly
VTQLEIALRSLANDPLTEPAPANLADRALARARQRTRRHRVVPVIGTAVAVAVLATGITVSQQQWGRTKTAPAASQGTATKPAPAFAAPQQTVLLIGSDAAPDRIGTRPDTIMLADVNTRTGATTLISLPRNLQRVPFPAGTPGAKAWPNGFACGSECLLNSVWFWAEDSKEYHGVKHPGLTATTQAVEAISGLTVDQTVVVNMKGLADLVDAVGGVDVTVRERLPIGGSANHRVAVGGWIEKGRQHLTGEQALWFARSRWSTDDYDRMKRQQCLVSALTEQVDGKKLLSAYPKIAKALRGNLSTSIASKDLAKWAELAQLMQKSTINRLSLDATTTSATDPDFAAIRRQVAAAVAVSSPSGKASSTPGTASSTPGKQGPPTAPC